jgi:hypothetical protein
VLFTDARHPYSKLLLASSLGRLDEMNVADREQLRASLRSELASRRATSRLVEVEPGHFVGTGDPDEHSPDKQSPDEHSPDKQSPDAMPTAPQGTMPPSDHVLGNAEASFATSRKEVE